MDDEAATDVVLVEVQRRIELLVRDHFAGVERNAIAWYENLVAKYGSRLRDLEAARQAAALRFHEHLQELGYA